MMCRVPGIRFRNFLQCVDERLDQNCTDAAAIAMCAS